mgnify:CR=1 FL=1
MQLTTRGRYGVMAMADLAFYSQAGKPVSLAQIANRQNISHAYLEQLFVKLRKTGLVKSVRGPGGGYLLAGEAEKMSIASIIGAVEEDFSIAQCGQENDDGCLGVGKCMTHDLWEDLDRHIINFLEDISLKDVIERRLDESSALRTLMTEAIATN